MQINILPNPKSKIFFASFLLSVSLIASSFAQDWHSVHDGMEYAEVTRTIDNQPVRMNLLRLDLKKVRLDVVHAMDAAIGTETTSSIATRHGAVAAINAGFFRLDNTIWAGDPSGLLVINGEVWSESQDDRVSIRISNSSGRSEVRFGHLEIEMSLEMTMSQHSFFVSLSGINRQRKADEMVVYTPVFGESTLSDSLGTDLIFSRCSGTLNCKIVTVSPKGNSRIPKDGFAVSIGPNPSSEASRLLERLKNQPSVGVVETSLFAGLTGGRPQFSLTSSDDITNGVPQLIKDRKINITWQEEKTTKSFVETRHPRTAVAKLKDGKFLMITVDGRSESSGGISLNDLAAYLLELGATDAMNLDGGGSTTMFLDGKVVNHPSDKEGERKVSDAILVTPRKKN